jgi:hypothetical protein
MRMHKLVLGLVAISACISQQTEAQTFETRAYNEKELERFAFDPPFWIFCGELNTKSNHWLYANHRFVFIDIKVENTDLP